jgi:hypothetical protein
MDYDPYKSSDGTALACWRNLINGIASTSTAYDVAHALDRLLAMQGAGGPDSHILVQRLGLDVASGSLLNIICDKTGSAAIELSHAQNMVGALIDRGANPLQGLGNDPPKTALGRLLDAASEAEYRQGDLTPLSIQLINAGDDPLHYLNLFKDGLGEAGIGQQGAIKACDLLKRCLTICGQRTLGVFLDERLRAQYQASELSKQTPAVLMPGPPRRM